MGWLVIGAAALYFLLRGGRRAPAPSPAATPATAATPASAHLAPVPPPPPPRGATVTITTTTPGDEAAVRASEQTRREEAAWGTADARALDVDMTNIPAALLAVVQQGGSANETELLDAAEESRLLGRTDLFNFFMSRVQRRRAAVRTFDIQEGPGTAEAVHPGVMPTGQGTTGTERVVSAINAILAAPLGPYAFTEHPFTPTPVRQLEMVEREVPQPRTVPGIPVASVQPTELPTAHATREELFQLAQRVADSIRRSGTRAYDRALLKTFQRGAGLGVDGDYGRQSAQALGHYGRFPAGQVPAPQY